MKKYNIANSVVLSIIAVLIFIIFDSQISPTNIEFFTFRNGFMFGLFSVLFYFGIFKNEIDLNYLTLIISTILALLTTLTKAIIKTSSMYILFSSVTNIIFTVMFFIIYELVFYIIVNYIYKYFKIWTKNKKQK